MVLDRSMGNVLEGGVAMSWSLLCAIVLQYSEQRVNDMSTGSTCGDIVTNNNKV